MLFENLTKINFAKRAEQKPLPGSVTRYRVGELTGSWRFVSGQSDCFIRPFLEGFFTSM
ncbi:hypothetical protein LJC36_05680 [Desulfovibrio sp. OttesenSCG-928-C14]|nr:hypothetical protein [Desulfovibrio sp. OttesenSCG-928-C14]